MMRTLLSMLVLTAFAAAHPLAQSAPAKANPQPAKANVQAASPGPVVNLNTATATDLQELPGIGAKVAARIVEYREKKGPFKKIEELMNVQGVGEKSFLKLRPQLSVGGKPEPAGHQ
jgi:competence protein ComEA